MQVKERGIILIPIDFTKQSLLAVKQSYNLAKYTHSKLVLLHVYTKTGEESYDALNKLTKQTEKRRDIKKDKTVKEKEKLWDTILVETGDSSSSDDEYGYGTH